MTDNPLTAVADLIFGPRRDPVVDRGERITSELPDELPDPKPMIDTEPDGWPQAPVADYPNDNTPSDWWTPRTFRFPTTAHLLRPVELCGVNRRRKSVTIKLNNAATTPVWLVADPAQIGAESPNAYELEGGSGIVWTTRGAVWAYIAVAPAATLRIAVVEEGWYDYSALGD